MNSACRRLSSGTIAGQDRHAVMLDALDEGAELVGVEHRLGDRELGARLDLVGEAAQLLVEVQRAGIDRDADVERGRAADRLAADVERRGSAATTTLVRPIESTSKTAVASG